MRCTIFTVSGITTQLELHKETDTKCEKLYKGELSGTSPVGVPSNKELLQRRIFRLISAQDTTQRQLGALFSQQNVLDHQSHLPIDNRTR